jgi:GT2 family glycosyltransferase
VIKALMKAPMIAALRGLGRSMTRKNNKPQSQEIKALMAANCARLNISVARRLDRLDAYKRQIARYQRARTRKLSRVRSGKRLAIYTAICSGYDSIKLPNTLDPRLDYILFSDRPAPATGVWQVRPVTYYHQDETRRARYVKTHPHLLLPDYDIAIWIDAHIMILGDIYPMIARFIASKGVVAAVPHPGRTSIYEELGACIQRKIDDAETMRQQVARYRAAGFDHSDLIETNLMMFRLPDQRARAFLDVWWREIDCYSKRDQLSVNYALQKAGITWHRLTQRPQSARDHQRLVLVPHDRATGPAQKLVDALQSPMADPYAGAPYAEVREQRIAAQRHRRIAIVICVHNAIDVVKPCLESVRRARRSDRQRLIIIDDGSEQTTARYLADFASGGSWVELHRCDDARGYTLAANQGLAASTGELVILLNSDTIVTDGWAEKLADAVFSTPGAGIVGPMSNAASHQSIPEHRGSNTQTAINELPHGVTAEDMNRYCEQWTVAGLLPRVPLIHGFCFGVTREVIERLGLFDHNKFPGGYGEENDYCFRAADAGFSLVVATHTYIWHAKSESYRDSERVTLMKVAAETFRSLHGRPRIERAVRTMQENPILARLRQNARRLPVTLSEAKNLSKDYKTTDHETTD